MISYATVDDLKAWLGLGSDEPTPPNAAARLRSACLLVTDAMQCDFYPVDDSYVPTDPVRLAAARDAVCAQVETWMTLNIDPAGGAAAAGRLPTSSSMLGDSVTYSTTSRNTDDRADAADTLCGQALLILREAGVGLGKPWAL